MQTDTAAPSKNGTADIAVAPKKRSIFDIGNDLQAIERLIEERDGDISDPEVAETISLWLAEFDAERAEKADRYVNLIRKWETEAAAAKAEAEQYQKAAQVRANRVRSLKQMLQMHMEASNLSKIETATGRVIAIQNNGGVVPMEVTETDPTALPDQYVRMVRVIDNSAIRADLEAGVELPWARLGVRGRSLRIR